MVILSRSGSSSLGTGFRHCCLSQKELIDRGPMRVLPYLAFLAIGSALTLDSHLGETLQRYGSSCMGELQDSLLLRSVSNLLPLLVSLHFCARHCRKFLNLHHGPKSVNPAKGEVRGNWSSGV